MPAVSEPQRKLFGAALAAKRGATPISKKVGDIAKATPEKELSKMASKDEDVMQPAYDNQIGDIYAVQRPVTHDCQHTDLVHKVDPMMGIQSMEIDPASIHGLYPDEDTAHQIAEKIHGDFIKEAQALETKKEKTINSVKKAIDKLEKKRKDHVNMAKEDPTNASKHKEHIAQLAHQIDDLMSKLERIEKSKKEIVKKEEEKEELKEALSKAKVLSPVEYQKEKKKKDFKASDWEYNKKEQLYKKK